MEEQNDSVWRGWRVEGPVDASGEALERILVPIMVSHAEAMSFIFEVGWNSRE